MASSIPSQTRAVDPFASFNSNTVNQLTEMITRGENGLTDYNALQVAPDSTAPFTQAVVSIGTIYKDDVMITLTQPHVVNFADPDHYVSFGGGFNEAGTYYIVLDYTYQKSRPAPQANIKILKPSQIPNPSLGTSLFFLKAVTVIFTGSTFRLDVMYDYDPAAPSVRRLYTPLYFGVETGLPTHVKQRDQGRVVYDSVTDAFYFGLENRWIESTGGAGGVLVTDVNTDSTSLWVGCIAYVDSGNNAQAAIATGAYTKGEIAVTNIGTVVANTASAVQAGTISGVRVEDGQVVGVGDVVYLSETQAGHVTATKPLTYIQDVGRALTAGDGTTDIEIIFLPRSMLSTSVKGTIYTTDWVSDSGSYRYDVDISGLDSTGFAIVTSFFALDSGVMEEITPSKMQLIDSGAGFYDTARVWMSVNTLDVLYNFSSGIGVPSTTSTGVSTYHSNLLHLDYAQSGHTGFAPDPHSNAYHSDPPSIPSGAIILFEADTAQTGYTLLTDINDEVVYITKGSAAGGETGGAVKAGSTWTQPVHAHIITPDGSTHVHTILDDGSHDHMFIHRISGDDVTWDGAGGTINLSTTATTSGQGVVLTADNAEIKSGTENLFTSIDGLHDHGGETSPGTDLHNHGGTTGDNATVNTWRPLGRNYTRQQRV